MSFIHALNRGGLAIRSPLDWNIVGIAPSARDRPTVQATAALARVAPAH